MAGATLDLVLHGHESINDALGRLIDKIERPEPIFKEMGEYLDLAHRERWDKQQAPDGSAWEPLSEVTVALKTKRKRPLDILVDSTTLRDTLRYQTTPFGLLFATDRPYGALHQFGGLAGRRRKVTIPARPWLGVSNADADELAAIIEDHLRP